MRKYLNVDDILDSILDSDDENYSTQSEEEDIADFNEGINDNWLGLIHVEKRGCPSNVTDEERLKPEFNHSPEYYSESRDCIVCTEKVTKCPKQKSNVGI